jgi:hypothetical protein
MADTPDRTMPGNVVVRQADDDYDALVICNAMALRGFAVVGMIAWKKSIHVYGQFNAPDLPEREIDRLDETIDAISDGRSVEDI